MDAEAEGGLTSLREREEEERRRGLSIQRLAAVLLQGVVQADLGEGVYE